MSIPQQILDQLNLVQADQDALMTLRTTAANSAAAASTAASQAAADAAAVTQAESTLSADLNALISMENQTYSPTNTKGLRAPSAVMPGAAKK